MQNKKLFRFRYDKAYKWLITYFLEDAIEFLHPNLFVLIDWYKEFVFQEQELANLSKNINKLYTKVDKLIEFTLLYKKKYLFYFILKFNKLIQLKLPKECLIFIPI